MDFLSIFITLFLSSQTLAQPVNSFFNISGDVGLNITAYVPRHGYPIETHEVTTEDGFIVGVHRIPHSRTGATGKPPVLMMHGLLSGSIDWVNAGPNKALGFLLSDLGYDVWMGNQRGNIWSRKHLTLDPVQNKSKYFDYSFHEIGVYDVAAMIDHILNVTGEEKIFYIGHSQGTSAYFALTATKPEYNDKVHLALMLAPVAYIQNAEHPIFRLVENYTLLIDLGLKHFGIYEILPHYPIITDIGALLCQDGSEFQDLCADVLYLFGGFDSKELNKTLIPMIVSNDPAGASLKQIIHYFQEHKSGKFQQYDYGLIENIARYGQTTPPIYNISDITTHLVLYWADKDLYSNPKDVDHLAEELPFATKVQVNFTDFTHIDYLWARDILELVYDNIVDTIQRNT